MTLTINAPKITGFGLAVNTAEALDTVVGAIIAGIALYFIKKSFLNNYPYYVSIILGFILTVFLGNYYLADIIGFALIADGLYRLISQTVTINS